LPEMIGVRVGLWAQGQAWAGPEFPAWARPCRRSSEIAIKRWPQDQKRAQAAHSRRQVLTEVLARGLVIQQSGDPRKSLIARRDADAEVLCFRKAGFSNPCSP